MAGQSILVVDDNVEFAVLLGTLIAEQGLTPVLAHNAATATALAKQYVPAAIVLDLLLPDMTGHKLLAGLSKLIPAPFPPVFVITGVFKGQAQMEKLKSVTPIAAWHEKPFDTRVLVEQIVSMVSTRPAVVREDHRSVAAVTDEFDINILDPVEAEGVRGPVPVMLSKEPSGDIELDVDVDENALAMWDVVGNISPIDLDEEVEDSEGGIVIDDLLLNQTGKFSQSKDPLEEETAKHSIMPPRTRETPALKKPNPPVLPQPPNMQSAPQRAPSVPRPLPAFGSPPGSGSQVIPVPPVRADSKARPPKPRGATPSKPGHIPKSTDDGFAGANTGTNPFKREHSPTPHEVRTGLRAKMRSGNLKPATVPRLLTAFFISQETGEIVFERNDERKVVYFSEGRPVYARSNQAEDRFGAFAMRKYGLTDDQIQRALQVAKSTSRMLGDVLIAERLIAETNKQDLLREQTRSIIKSLLTWSEGRYVIGFNVQETIERAELSDHPAELVLLSVRELFDLARLRQLVPDKMKPMPSPNPPYELHDLPMGDAEALLVLRSTGARGVDELIKEIASRLDEQSARAHIYALLTLGVLVAGRAPPREMVPVVI